MTEHIEKSKKKNIRALIRCVTLQPEHLESLIPMLVVQTIARCSKDANPGEVSIDVKKRIADDEFLNQLIPPFEKLFSGEEIKNLLDVYQSEVMRKFSKNQANCFTPLYSALHQMIQEVLNPYPSITKSSSEPIKDDEILSITSASYQQDVKRSARPVIMDVYSSSCTPCKMLYPIFVELSNEFVDKIRFTKLKLDEETSLAQDLEIYAVPTFLFFKDGNIVGRHVGIIDKEGLAAKINTLLL